MELKCLKKERGGEKVKVNDPGAVICIYSFVRLSLQCEQRYNQLVDHVKNATYMDISKNVNLVCKYRIAAYLQCFLSRC